jgi:hypothetical protein
MSVRFSTRRKRCGHAAGEYLEYNGLEQNWYNDIKWSLGLSIVLSGGRELLLQDPFAGMKDQWAWREGI